IFSGRKLYWGNECGGCAACLARVLQGGNIGKGTRHHDGDLPVSALSLLVARPDAPPPPVSRPPQPAALPSMRLVAAGAVMLFPAGNSYAENVANTGLVLALLHAWAPPFALTLNFPSWSLSAEMFFYLLFPSLVTAATRRPLKAVIAFALIALALEAAASLVY